MPHNENDDENCITATYPETVVKMVIEPNRAHCSIGRIGGIIVLPVDVHKAVRTDEQTYVVSRCIHTEMTINADLVINGCWLLALFPME